MNLLEKIDYLCKEKNISRRTMEVQAGIGVGLTSKWTSENIRPSQKTLEKLSNYFGVSIAYLIGESDHRTQEEENITKWMKENDCEALADETRKFEAGMLIPVLGNVAAGIPIEAIEEVMEWEEIPLRVSKTGTFFGLKIKGDSMSPRIEEGDIVIVRQQEQANNGDLIIAKVNGDEACCKKLIIHNDGIVLQSFNPAYEPMYFSKAEMEKKPVAIIGKVVELRGKF